MENQELQINVWVVVVIIVVMKLSSLVFPGDSSLLICWLRSWSQSLSHTHIHLLTYSTLKNYWHPSWGKNKKTTCLIIFSNKSRDLSNTIFSAHTYRDTAYFLFNTIFFNNNVYKFLTKSFSKLLAPPSLIFISYFHPSPPGAK